MTKLEMFYLGVSLFFVGFIIAETAYFGWNLKAASKAEMICDYLAFGVMWTGIFLVVRCFVSDN